MSEVSFGNVYQMNKELSQKEKLLDPIILNQKLAEVARSTYKCQYLMLLCHEKRDYTIFNQKEIKSSLSLVDDLRETLQNRGQIVSIDKTKDGAWEIWIRDYEDYCYYLFDYTAAVIEVN